MGDELRHLNSSCGCGMPEDNACEDNSSCGLGGKWFWIILIFIFCCCSGGSSSGICGINTCSIDCGDLLTIIIILLVLNCICGGEEGGILGGFMR